MSTNSRRKSFLRNLHKYVLTVHMSPVAQLSAHFTQTYPESGRLLLNPEYPTQKVASIIFHKGCYIKDRSPEK